MAVVAACGLVLAVSAVAHLRNPRGLARALAVHGVVPLAAWWPAAVVVVVVETVLAAALVAAALLPAGPPTRPVAGAAAGVFLVFALYLTAVLRRGDAVARARCGCGLGDEPVSWVVVARAAALAVLAAVAAMLAPTEPLLARPLGERTMLAAAALVLAALVARLPALARRSDSVRGG